MALKEGIGLQAWEIAVTKKLVGEFRRRSRSLAIDEFDDLVQECLMHWLDVRQRAAPSSDGPPIGYMARVLHNKLIDLARERESDKRRGDLTSVSLDEPVGESEDAPTLADLIDAERGQELGGKNERDAADARLDIDRVMRQLTSEQRRLCELLGTQGLSIKEASEKLRIPRGTLYEEIKRIRRIFADYGLDAYLRD